jgi:hypothetical protein
VENEDTQFVSVEITFFQLLGLDFKGEKKMYFIEKTIANPVVGL